MKMAKRILSLLLVLTMIACLSVTAFADTAYATVIIKANGVTVASNTAVRPGRSVYDYISGIYGTDGWSSFTDYYGQPAKALDSLTIEDKTYAAGTVDGSATDVKVEAWGETYDGYGLKSVVKNGDEITGYNFVYVGNSWVYSVSDANGAEVDVSAKYMNQYTMNAGDVVVLEYKLVVSEWYSEYPLVEEYPYC